LLFKQQTLLVVPKLMRTQIIRQIYIRQVCIRYYFSIAKTEALLLNYF